MLLVGLTGGVAAGKSIVAAEMKRLGASIVDADAISREVSGPGTPVFIEMVAAFGKEFVKADGTLDRRAVGEAVFGDPEKLRKLNEITHPKIRAIILERIKACAEADPDCIVIVDAPLLIETGLYRKMDRIVVVNAPDETQVKRLRERDGFTSGEAEKRIASQLPVSRKVDFADFVIEGGGSLEETIAAAGDVFECLCEAAGGSCDGLK